MQLAENGQVEKTSRCCRHQGGAQNFSSFDDDRRGEEETTPVCQRWQSEEVVRVTVLVPVAVVASDVDDGM